MSDERFILRGISQRYDELLAYTSKTPWGDEVEGLMLLPVANQLPNARVIVGDGDRRDIAIVLRRGFWRSIWAACRLLVSLSPEMRAFTNVTAPPETIRLRSHRDLLGPRFLGTPADWNQSQVVLAQTIFNKAIAFVLFHEMAHVARGHLDIVEGELGLDFIDEGINMAAIASDGSEVLRALEFDADHHGLDMLWEEWEEHLQSRISGDADRDRPRKTEGNVLLSMVAIILVFMLLDAEHGAIDKAYLGDHPPPVHRAARAARLWAETSTREFRIDPDIVRDLHDDAWVAVAYLAEALALPPGRWHGDTIEGMDLDRLDEEDALMAEMASSLHKKWFGTS